MLSLTSKVTEESDADLKELGVMWFSARPGLQSPPGQLVMLSRAIGQRSSRASPRKRLISVLTPTPVGQMRVLHLPLFQGLPLPL